MSDITFKFESKINQNKENIIKKYIYKIEKKKIKEFSILIFISIRWHITGYVLQNISKRNINLFLRNMIS